MAEERKKFYKTFKINAVELSRIEFCSKQGKRNKVKRNKVKEVAEELGILT